MSVDPKGVPGGAESYAALSWSACPKGIVRRDEGPIAASPGRLLTSAAVGSLAQQVDVPEVACGLLDQVQEDPAQRHVPLGRDGVEGGGAYHYCVEVARLGSVLDQEISHGRTRGHPPLGVGRIPVQAELLPTRLSLIAGGHLEVVEMRPTSPMPGPGVRTGVLLHAPPRASTRGGRSRSACPSLPGGRSRRRGVRPSPLVGRSHAEPSNHTRYAVHVGTHGEMLRPMGSAMCRA